MLIRERLENNQFSNTEKVIVNYILNNINIINKLSMRDIASETYTSPSTLTRIAKKMNYNGWNDLKDALIKEDNYLKTYFCNIDANYPFNKEDTFYNIASKLAILKTEAINDTLSLITQDNLDKAINIINQASSIRLFGLSSNLNILKQFEYNLKKINKKIDTSMYQGDGLYNACQMDNMQCAIIVSYSGERADLCQIAKVLKDNHIPIIVITNISDNTLSSLATCVLTITTREKLHSKIASYTTDIAISYLLDVIYSCLFSLDYDNNLKQKITISKKIDKYCLNTVTVSNILSEE